MEASQNFFLYVVKILVTNRLKFGFSQTVNGAEERHLKTTGCTLLMRPVKQNISYPEGL